MVQTERGWAGCRVGGRGIWLKPGVMMPLRFRDGGGGGKFTNRTPHKTRHPQNNVKKDKTTICPAWYTLLYFTLPGRREGLSNPAPRHGVSHLKFGVRRPPFYRKYHLLEVVHRYTRSQELSNVKRLSCHYCSITFQFDLVG